MFESNYKPSDQPHIKKVYLDVVEETVRKRFALDGISTADFKFQVEQILDDMVFTLSYKCARQDLGTCEVKYPANWWEAFKERWFPNFLLDYFPVKYTTVTIGAEAFYDRIAIPKEMIRFRIYSVEVEESK